jgi:polysaccharide biosynthesis protein VpsM
MTTKRFVALSTLAAVPAFAAPFLAIGENAELFVTAKAGVTYTDNLFSSDTDEEEDFIFTLTPGIEIKHGKSSLLKGTLSAAYELSAYADNDNNNNQLAKLAYNASYSGARLLLKGNLGYNEFSQNTPDLPGTTLNEYAITNGGISGEYALTEKFALGLGIGAQDTNYDDVGTDNSSFTIPLDLFYKIAPKTDLNAGYAYTNTNVDGGNIADTEDHSFYVGARGELFPKLTGSVKVGYSIREFDASGQDNESTPFASIGLGYAITPKTNITLDGYSRFATSANAGDSFENRGLNLGANTAFAEDLSGRVYVGYSESDYKSGRELETLRAGLGFTYIVTENLSADFGYGYEDNDANDGTDFTKNTVGVSASFRY